VDFLIPIILIILSNIIANYLCKNTCLMNYLKKKVKTGSTPKIDIISFSLVFLMIIIYYFITRLDINKEIVQVILFLITVTFINIMMNLKKYFKII